MISEKSLFSIMLKYHPAIVGRLIHRGFAKKEDDKIVLHNNKTKEKLEINYNCFEELETNRFNVTKVVASSLEMQRKNIYLEVRTSYPEIFQDLDAQVYNSNFESCYKYFCLPSILPVLLTKFSDKIDSISLPKGYIVSKELVPYYISILQRQIETIKEYKREGCHMSSLEGKYQMFSYKDYGIWPHQSWYEYIEKCDFLSYLPLYYEIEWNFDMVDKYKEKILWLNLMEDSNLHWTEEDIITFDSYIPHMELRSSKIYCNKSVPTAGYGRIELFSNQYLESHKDIINWKVFVETGKFNWDPNDLRYFYEYANRKDETFTMYELSRNPSFTWTPDMLKTMIELCPDTLNYCINEKKFADMLFMIPNYKELVKEHNDDPDFWRKLHDGGKKKHNAYSEFFTIDSIEKKKDEWSKEIEDKFIFVDRTPDTNYHYHAVFTMWDYFDSNEAVLMTYDLSKYLQTITIVLGGTYVLEDGINIGEDNRYPHYNGLDIFSSHKIANEEEMDKICSDIDLIDSFINRHMGRPNTDIVDYLIDSFFKDYKMDDYISIVNGMKDWGSIIEYT